MKIEQGLKMIVNASKDAFEKEVNAFLEEATLFGFECEATFAACPWKADGLAGTEFCAFLFVY